MPATHSADAMYSGVPASLPLYFGAQSSVIHPAISSLLIEAPGENTVKNNQAHFIKSGMVEQVDAYWAAVALYTLQTFAPSGGQGSG